MAIDVEIDATRLAKFENGTAQPTEIELRRLAARLRVAPEFFLREAVRELDEESLHFRCKQSARQVARRQAVAQATLLDEWLRVLDQKVSLPRLKLPSCAGCHPEEAAMMCRESWGLTRKGPLADIQREAELSGVFVVMGPLSLLTDVDAFSTRVSTDAALIVLNPGDPPSRNAFNIGHELAHLILHEGIETGDRDTEREADQFASALLMPREGFSESWRKGPGRPDFPWLMKMKLSWRVSMQAMVRRAFDLQLITHATYEHFFKAINHWGWRKDEPGEFEWWPPQLLADCMEATRQSFGLGADHFARELGVRLSMLEGLSGLKFDASEEEEDDVVSSNVVVPHPRWA